MFLKMSFSGGILILFWIIVRFVFKSRLPKRLFVVLWDIALLRLLLPIELPLPYETAAQRTKMAGSSIFSYGNVVENAVDVADRPVVRQAAERIAFETVTLKNDLFSRVDVHLLTIVWLAGAVLLFCIFALLYGREYRRIREALPVLPERESYLRSLAVIPDRIKILISDRIATPLTFGILSPQIILPKVLEPMNGRQLKYILTHEVVHIKRADNLRKVFMLSAVCLHWFNPMVWFMLILSGRDMELACDESVITLLGEKEKKEYASTLVYFSERQNMLFSNGFGKKAIQERVEEIMKYKKATIVSVLCGIVLAGIAVSAFMQTSLSTNAQEFTLRNSGKADAGSFYLVADSEFFPEYEKCGISYDKATGQLLYEGEVVGLFHDETAPGVYTHIVGGNGTVGVRVARNKANQIIGVRIVSIADGTTGGDTVENNGNVVSSDFAGESTTDASMEENGNDVSTDFYTSRYAGTDYTYQEGGQNKQMLEEYVQYKIEYGVQGWTYDGKWITGLFDEQKKYIFVNDGYPYGNADMAENVYLLFSDGEMVEISGEDFWERVKSLGSN